MTGRHKSEDTPPEVDQDLPAAPDQGLPEEAPPAPDQGTPETPPAPDQGAPEAPPEANQDLPDAPDQSLPEAPPEANQDLPATPTQRPAGPLDEGYADEETPVAPDSVALLEMIAVAEKVEIVFSDGEKELASITAIQVKGAVWNPIAGGLQLQTPIEIKGGEAAEELAGYALFIDGEQVAWARRDPVFRIAPGATVNLTGDIVFPG